MVGISQGAFRQRIEPAGDAAGAFEQVGQAGICHDLPSRHTGKPQLPVKIHRRLIVL
jgi:hypothetical protein